MPDPQLSKRAAWSAGQPISDLMHRALAASQLISLAAGFVDPATLPVSETREALAEILGDELDAQAALQYGTTHGFPRLREQIREMHLTSDGGAHSQPPIDLHQVMLTAGSNQLLHIVSETLLNPGDIVLCASPTYFVYLGTLKNMGARAIGIEADDDGIVPEALEHRLQQLQQAGELARVKMIYVVSFFDNPRGLSTSAKRRAEIVELAQKFSAAGKIYVLADDAYRELRYAGEDVPSFRTHDDAAQHVIQSGTFSKCFSPGVRVGWGILPPELVTPVHDQKGNLDFGSPNFAQHLVERVIAHGRLKPHTELLRASYRTKLQAMLAAAREHLGPLGCRWVEPAGGLYVWLTLPEGLDAGMQGQLFDLALKEGMLYVPGQFFYPDEGAPAQRNTIRLSFGVQSPGRITEGISKLAAAIRTVARTDECRMTKHE
jgi:2-aminoadipate transaminase